MKYGLGIDTGGTYTDAVIYDFESGEVLSTAKSITVKEDLTIGINNTLDQLPADTLQQVSLISLSTTLATNACVEGKGSRAKLILIGCNKEIVHKYGQEYGLPEASQIIFLEGGHNQQGEVKGEPDWEELRTRVEECRHITDAFAVVELWGVKNAHFERKAKEWILDWTGIQVVCGHELTGEINSLKRAASALLNAQLIPLINDFLDAVKRSMKEKEIQAPLVIVRGDGSLMSEEIAREKPVETLLSGPAASIAGGINLTGEQDCIIVDMGGTTSDLAIVSSGFPKLTAEGASVGKWRTGIHSMYIHTVGLGGDSLIRHNGQNDLTIGPVRAAPLAWLATRWPGVLEKIRELQAEKKKHTVSLCEFFYLIRDISTDAFYSEEEVRIVAALKNGPLSITELAKAAGTSIYEIRIKRLEQLGAVMRCGLTPTDIMHLTGDFTGWSEEAARLGAIIMAHQLNIGVDVLTDRVWEQVKKKLYLTITAMLLENEDERLLKNGMTEPLEQLLEMSYRQGRDRVAGTEKIPPFQTCTFSTRAKLVGIGAPIHIFLPDVAKILGTAYVIPENAGVANAIGAITGNVVVEESVTIRPRYGVSGINGYIGFSSANRKEFPLHREAVEWAREEAVRLAVKKAGERGAGEVAVHVAVKHEQPEISLPHMEKGKTLLLETVVTAKAVGKLKWI